MADATDYRQEWEETYRQAYAEGRRHWRPELASPSAFVAFMQSQWAPQKGSRILEAGCGDGLNAIYLAQSGYEVTGVDVSEAAIARAREAAIEHDSAVEFLCLDLVHDELPTGTYDLWVDIKTLHCLWKDADRHAYLSGVVKALRKDGILFLNCGLALADVRSHFQDVFAALDPTTRAQADCLDRDLPFEQQRGIRCETLHWYCQELTDVGLSICDARREASVQSGWGTVIVARKENQCLAVSSMHPMVR